MRSQKVEKTKKKKSMCTLIYLCIIYDQRKREEKLNKGITQSISCT
jgi:hypothetical protein